MGHGRNSVPQKPLFGILVLMCIYCKDAQSLIASGTLVTSGMDVVLSIKVLFSNGVVILDCKIRRGAHSQNEAPFKYQNS